jgi:signal peptidase I
MNPQVTKDQVIARGYVDTGDQVIVDKFTYHWRRPKRSEVFVFNTQNIPHIQANLMRENPEFGSQHYIKRLSGVPGDHLEIKPPELWINGERAKEKGFQKIMSQKNGYEGYTYYGGGGIHDITLGPLEYWALGDNTNNSSDSRVFRTVPGKDIVGRAIFVYLPFGNHFGPIR